MKSCVQRCEKRLDPRIKDAIETCKPTPDNLPEDESFEDRTCFLRATCQTKPERSSFRNSFAGRGGGGGLIRKKRMGGFGGFGIAQLLSELPEASQESMVDFRACVRGECKTTVHVNLTDHACEDQNPRCTLGGSFGFELLQKLQECNKGNGVDLDFEKIKDEMEFTCNCMKDTLGLIESKACENGGFPDPAELFGPDSMSLRPARSSGFAPADFLLE